MPLWTASDLFVPIPLPEMEPLLERAAAAGLNAEIQGLLEPDVLDGPYESCLRRIDAAFGGFPGRVTVHGPFMDLNPISRDPKVAAVSRRRYEQAFEIAYRAGAGRVLFHSQCSAFIRDPGYLASWESRSVEFWRERQPAIEKAGMTVVFENVFETDPGPQSRLVDSLSPGVFGAALDTGHAHLFSGDVPSWVAGLGRRIRYVHLHDNDGRWDLHLPPGEGTAALADSLMALSKLEVPPPLCLEVFSEDGVRKALDWFAASAFSAGC